MADTSTNAPSRISVSFAFIFSLVLQKPASGNCCGQRYPDAHSRPSCGLTDSGNCHMFMHVKVRLAVQVQCKGNRRKSRCYRFAPPETRILPAHKLSGYSAPCPIKHLPVLALLHSLQHYAPTPFSGLPIRSAYVPKTHTCYANPSILREWREVLCQQPTWDLVQAQPCLAPT
jgi:hypothetical protein